MWQIHWWLLPLTIGIVAGQDGDDESSLDNDEPLFDLDFSESENVADVPEEVQSFGNLDDTVNALTKMFYGDAMKDQKEKETKRLAEMHRQREALEAQLASTNEGMFGRMGGRMVGGRRAGVGRLGFGASDSSIGSETPKSSATTTKSDRNKSAPEETAPEETDTYISKEPEGLQDRSTGGGKGGISDKEIVQLLASNLGVTLRPPKGYNSQRCFECKNVQNAEGCLQSGGIKTCNRGEACQTEIRWENGKVKLESTCKQKNACMVMIRQNENCNRLKGQKGVNRTCWRCCTGDLCNLANINPDRI